MNSVHSTNAGWIGGDGRVMLDNDNKYRDFVATIDEVQTIYFDVRRTGYITVDGNNTIVTLANDQVIQHIELTKSGNGFTFCTPETLGFGSANLATYPYVSKGVSQP